MLRKLVAFLLMLALVFTFGCKKDSPTEVKKNVEFETVAALGDVYFTNYVTTSGAGVNLGIADLFTNLQDGNTANDPLILDYRSAADYASGHIRGAENITLASLADRVGTMSKTKKIVNVCYTGQTSSFATAFLNLMGFDSQSLSFGMCGVSTTTGITGTDKWATQIAADEFASQLTATATTTSTAYTFPVLTTGKTAAEDIMVERFKAVNASWSISAADVFANPSNYFIINYWPMAEYTNPGHIPGAFCFEPKTSLKTDAMLKYLPTDKTIVVYCYTGQTSAQVCAYLQMLGYNAKSLLYGMNGFAYGKMTKSKYTVPTTDYTAIIVK
jgi:rhodanese-related sulfurtransferase